ncbi:hypothetical protein ES695_05975 [Candidatus Atribacteria bacterium 1244-E10-H5-B2]|nr:MAG: hypothetical protein ES695_05975 [Candidatus Atribacteria bacterium 1244-E10-H5-B2]
MPKMSKKEQDEAIDEFLKYVDGEIDRWGIYKKSPEIQEKVKKNIIKGLIQLTGTKKIAMIDRLLENKIFTISGIDEALEIPIEERYTYSLKDLFEADLKDEELLMGRGFMPTKGYMVLSAPTKAGKTIFSLKLALHLALGIYFLDIPVMKKCKVLFVYAESSPGLLNDTYKKIVGGMKARGIKIDKNIIDNLKFHDAILHNTNFNRNSDLRKFKKTVDLFCPDVIILDPIDRITGLDLNPTKNVVSLLNQVLSVKRGFWLWVLHNRKRTAEKEEEDIEPIYKVMGSSNITGFAETTICIEPTGKKDPKNFKKLYLYYRRWPSPTIPVEVKWDRDNLNFELIENLEFKRPEKCSVSDLIAFINEEFKGSAPRNDIVDSAHQEFAVSGRHIYEQINKGINEGLLAIKGNNIIVVGSQMDLY